MSTKRIKLDAFEAYPVLWFEEFDPDDQAAGDFVVEMPAPIADEYLAAREALEAAESKVLAWVRSEIKPKRKLPYDLGRLVREGAV